MSSSKESRAARELSEATGMQYRDALAQVRGQNLIDGLLADEHVSDVHIFGTSYVMFRNYDGLWWKRPPVGHTDEIVANVIRHVAMSRLPDPELDTGGMFPLDAGNVSLEGQMRMFAVYTSGGSPQAVVRKFKKVGPGFLVDANMMSAEDADRLVQAVRDGRNVAVVGATGTGKTAVLQALLSHAEADYAVAEEVAELDLSRPVFHRQTIERQLEEILDEGHRTVFVGEVRGGEVYRMVSSSDVQFVWTMHGEKVEDVPGRMRLYMKFGSPEVLSDEEAFELTEKCVDVVVVTSKERVGENGRFVRKAEVHIPDVT